MSFHSYILHRCFDNPEAEKQGGWMGQKNPHSLSIALLDFNAVVVGGYTVYSYLANPACRAIDEAASKALFKEAERLRGTPKWKKNAQVSYSLTLYSPTLTLSLTHPLT